MTDQEIRDLIAELHCPEARNNSMVYSVWEDGEVTLEKGGELFGLRNLHMIEPGGKTPCPVDWFPIRNHDGSHGRVFAADKESAERLARAINPEFEDGAVVEFIKFIAITIGFQ